MQFLYFLDTKDTDFNWHILNDCGTLVDSWLAWLNGATIAPIKGWSTASCCCFLRGVLVCTRLQNWAPCIGVKLNYEWDCGQWIVFLLAPSLLNLLNFLLQRVIKIVPVSSEWVLGSGGLYLDICFCKVRILFERELFSHGYSSL